jgi:hypothetical protein
MLEQQPVVGGSAGMTSLVSLRVCAFRSREIPRARERVPAFEWVQ